MEWRCEWCGKPHAEDDPPCDNCGHGTFEKAVVQQGPVSEGPNETTLWVCTECGRAHTKHSPPCSRCGNPTLEREVRSVDDDELVVPSYFDLLTPKYVLGLVLVLGLAAVFLLGLAGVVDLPGMNSGVPEVSNVPGDATSADGISLAETENVYLAELNDRREVAGLSPLSTDAHLNDVAQFVNQKLVKAEHAGGDMPDGERLGNLLSQTCSGEGDPTIFLLSPENGTAVADTPDDLATALIAERSRRTSGFETYSQGVTGLDLHAMADGTVYLTQWSC